jgi:hypothetical protein
MAEARPRRLSRAAGARATTRAALCAATIAMAATSGARRAAANASEFADEDWALLAPLGYSTGWTSDGHRTRGADLSLIYAPGYPPGAFSYGLDLDWLQVDDDRHGSRHTVGVELNALIFGVDVGAYGERVDGASRSGPEARFCLLGVVVFGCVRWLDPGARDMRRDVMLMVKIPIPVAGGNRHYDAEDEKRARASAPSPRPRPKRKTPR